MSFVTNVLRRKHEAKDLSQYKEVAQMVLAGEDSPDCPVRVGTFIAALEAIRNHTGFSLFLSQVTAAEGMHAGRIVELATGEGKTLAAVPAVAALCAEYAQVHVITSNDYLAKRDAQALAPIYEELGLTVGHLTDDMNNKDERRANHACDVIYATTSQLVFDFLRDQLVLKAEERVGSAATPLAAVIDEADSVLLDEARTPMIISTPRETNVDATTLKLYRDIVADLEPATDYAVDTKEGTVLITDEGIDRASSILPERVKLFEKEGFRAVNLLENALKAKELYIRDVDYIVKDDQLVLIDHVTGRALPDHSWQDGLHEAVQVKEDLEPKLSDLAASRITTKFYFGRYAHVCGMTGTAADSAEELDELYRLEVVPVPPNKPVIRIENPDIVMADKVSQIAEVVAITDSRRKDKQPVLIGVPTVDLAEEVSTALDEAGVPHNLLTAKDNASEAEIVKAAGAPGTVTVATNMAGRGTDIKIVGDSESPAHPGGLFVIGVGRNNSRRTDRQLAGRSGRQGDPGEVQFVLSAEDSLLSHYGDNAKAAIKRAAGVSSNKKQKIMQRLVDRAQDAVDAEHALLRSRATETDGILDVQRQDHFARRSRIIEEGYEHMYDRAVAGLQEAVDALDPGAAEDLVAELGKGSLSYKHGDSLADVVSTAFDRIVADVGQPLFDHTAQSLLLQFSDRRWIEHLADFELLKKASTLRQVAQRDPNAELLADSTASYEQAVADIPVAALETLLSLRSMTPDEKASVPNRKARRKKTKR